IETLSFLADFYREQERPGSLLPVVERLILLHPEKKVRHNLYAEMAKIYLYHKKDIPKAIQSLIEALKLDDQSLPLIEALKYLLRKENRHKELICWIRKELSLHKNDVDTYEARLELAELLLEQLEKESSKTTVSSAFAGEGSPVVKEEEGQAELQEEKINEEEILEEIFQLLYPLLDNKGDIQRRSYDLLQKAYGVKEDWEGLMEVLRKQLETAVQPAERIEILLQLAQIGREKLKLPRIVKTFYQQILDLDPSRKDVLLLMEQLLTELEEWEELVQFYNQRASFASHLLSAVKDFIKAGWISKDHLKDLNKAYYYYDLGFARSAKGLEELSKHWEQKQEEALNLAVPPTEDLPPGAEDASHSALQTMENPNLSQNEIQKEISEEDMVESPLLEENPPERSLIEENQKESQEKKAQRKAELEAEIQDLRIQIHELEECYNTCLTSLIHIARTTQNYSALERLLNIQAQKIKEENPYEYAVILAERAQILENEMGDRKGAMEVWEEVLKLQPGHREALSALDRLYTRLERWQPLIEVLYQQSELSREETQKGEIYFRMGRIFHNQISHLEQSQEYLERAWEIFPERMELIEELEEVYQESLEYEKWVKKKKKKVELISEKDQKIELLLKRGEILEEKIRDFPRAISNYLEILKLDPRNQNVRDHIKSLYETVGGWAEIIQLLEEELEWTEDSEKRVRLYTQIGELSYQKLNLLEKGCSAFEKAFDLERKNDKVREFLKILYPKLEKHEALVQLYQVELALASNLEEKIEAQHHLGDAYRHGLKDDINSICAFEEALKLKKDDWVSIAALEELYPRVGRWLDLARLLGQAAELADSTKEKVRYLLARGKVLDENCKNTALGLETLEEAHQLDPENSEVLELMKSYSESLENWDKAIYAGQKLLAHRKDAGLRDLYYDLSRIFLEEKGDAKQAREYVEPMLKMESLGSRELELATRVFQELKEWNILVDILHQRQEIAKDAAQKAELLYESAIILEEHLNQREKATEVLEKVVDLNPSHVEGLSKLAHNLYEFENYEKALGFLDKLAGFLEVDHPDFLRTHYRLGQIYQKQKNYTKAIYHYLEALKADPKDEASLKEVSKIYLEQEDFEKAYPHLVILSEVYEEKEKPDLDLLKKVGSLGRRLEKFETSFQTYEKALALASDDLEILGQLTELAEILENFSQAVEYLEESLKVAKQKGKDGNFMATLFYRRGVLALEKLNQPEKALSSFEKAITFDSNYYPPYKPLIEAAVENTNWEMVLKYAPRAIQLSEKKEEKVDYYLALSKALSKKGDFERALKAAHAGMELNPSYSPLLEEALRIHALQGHWPQVAELMEQYIQVKKGTEEELSLHDRLARIYEEKLNDKEKAITQYKWVLKLDPHHQGAHSGLARLYRQIPSRIRDAIQEYYYFIEKEPWNTDHLRNLLTLFYETKQLDGWLCLAEILDKMEALVPSEKEAFARGSKRMKYLSQAVPSTVLDQHCTLELEKSPLSKILRLLEGELIKVFPPTKIEEWGLRKKDILKGDQPLAQMVGQFQNAFGSFDIHL
ncbi:MAG: tetratricopeptide repeat protein, partial [Planctomycetota bacterium]